MKRRKQSSPNVRHNEQIRISPIFLINEKDEKIGQISTAEAQKMARDAGLDLVEVAPTARPPVCRIMDYGKWKYQQQKKEDKARASGRAGQLKEIKMRTAKIGEHDLMIKVNHAREFLESGHKVQFTLQFRGREMAHQEIGRNIFHKIKDELQVVSKVERDMKMMGRRMTMVLQPDRKQQPDRQAGEKHGANPAGASPDGRAGSSRPAVSGERLNIPAPAPAQAQVP